jgi:hypothetical protein
MQRARFQDGLATPEALPDMYPKRPPSLARRLDAQDLVEVKTN